MSSIRFPNLFIVGAPKCGTTALSHYLAGHPQIFMSEKGGTKEPYYFSSDLEFSHITRISDVNDYLKLFEQADHDDAYWGDASVTYLYSKCAVPQILQTCHAPRFIVMLRNPIELTHSLHNENVKSSDELPDFELCWRLQASRLKGHNLPSRFSNGAALQYGEIAKTGAQLERMLTRVDRERVHIILYDDFSRNTAESYATTLDWLGLAHDGQTEFKRINHSITYEWPGLEYALRKIRTVRSALGLPGGLGIHALIDRFNKKDVREPLRPAFRQELCEYFRDDIKLLSQLLDRDLSHWLD